MNLAELHARIQRRRVEQVAHTLDEYDAAIIRFLHTQGFSRQRIAALFDVNQRRVSEVITDDRLPGNTLLYDFSVTAEDTE